MPEWLEAYNKNEKKVSCLFGAHLLNRYPQNPVALVEAPKTAIYGTLYFGFPKQPTNFIWLAVYNKSSFSFDKLKVLQGRDVFVFPDLSKDGSTFIEWEQKAKDYEKQLPRTKFIFSDLLEDFALDNDRKDGNDIADFLIKQDWRLFRQQPPQERPEPDFLPEPSPGKVKTIQPDPVTPVEVEKEQPENWDNEISELETFFNQIELLPAPVNLNDWTTITDTRLFIDSNLATLKANNGKRTFLPYLKQLQTFKMICS